MSKKALYIYLEPYITDTNGLIRINSIIDLEFFNEDLLIIYYYFNIKSYHRATKYNLINALYEIYI